MNKEEVRARMAMKILEHGHMPQYHELLRYVFQVTARKLQETGWDDAEVAQAKMPGFEKATVIGWFDGDKLASQLVIYPMKVNIHGTIFDMGGLTGVGTYPEYGGMRLMDDLIVNGLTQMRESGRAISFLYPYSIPYYRKRGWELISDTITYKIRDTQLPKTVPVSGMMERVDSECDDIKALYDRYARKTHGALIRDELAWEEYYRWEQEGMLAAIYYDEQSIPQGYILYWIGDDTFRIKELLFASQEARHGLWNFVTAHFSMIDSLTGTSYTNEPLAFLLEDSAIKETIRPYYMARIVDVEAFLAQFPYDAPVEPFHFVVEDPLLPWNRGVFSLSWDAGKKVTVGREPIGKAVKLSIGTLTTMLMSYKRPAYLEKIGRLTTDRDMIEMLDDMIPQHTPYFSDYF